MREKLRLGMHVNVRGSSLCDVVPDLIRGLDGHRWYDHVSFCTDDVHASDLLADGHVNRVVKRAVAAGMSSLDAIKCATLNAAKELGIQDLGAVAPAMLLISSWYAAWTEASQRLSLWREGRWPKTACIQDAILSRPLLPLKIQSIFPRSPLRRFHSHRS